MPLHAKKSAGKITVLLTDDSSIYRESLCMFLESDERIEIVGQAANGREAVKKASALGPDVILMDVGMPLLNGLDAAERILRANRAAKVLMLSAHDDEAFIERAIALGAVGFLTKQTVGINIADAICDVADGKTLFSRAIKKRMAATFKERRLTVSAALRRPSAQTSP